MIKSLDILLKEAKLFHADYPEQYAYILDLIEKNRIKPVKTSELNGKDKPLHTRYHIIEEKKDHTQALEELQFTLHPPISTTFYRQHLDKYEEERDAVLRLNTFLLHNESLLKIAVSTNERSFQIWQEEKFLTSSRALTILEHCHITMKYLNVYETAEPFAYFSIRKTTPQTIIILENKDPFYSMRKALLAGSPSLLGRTVATILYGAGKRIHKSFAAFDESAEDYLKDPENTFLYFGDLDYEGIKIFETLASHCTFTKITPFREAYIKMLEKAEGIQLSKTKEKQNRNISGLFFSFFEQSFVDCMKQILESDRYIPQEILNITDYRQ